MVGASGFEPPLLVPKQEISTTYSHRLLKIKELHGLFLDPKGEDGANLVCVGPCLDPDFHVGDPRALARPRSHRHPKNPTKIYCTDRISKSHLRAPSERGNRLMWRIATDRLVSRLNASGELSGRTHWGCLRLSSTNIGTPEHTQLCCRLR